MKLLTYNIFNGGQDGEDAANVKHALAPRLSRIIEVVRSEDPDVVVLAEANHFMEDRFERLREFEAATGLTGIVAKATSGFHVAVLVRQGLEVEDTGFGREDADPALFHTANSVTVTTVDGQEIRIIGIHLAPFEGDRRLREVQWISERIDPDSLTLITGDFNSLDDGPMAPDYKALQTLPEEHRRRHLINGAGTEIDTRAIKVLNDIGFVDVFAELNPEEAGATVPTKFYGDEFTEMRLDYVFATPMLAKVAKSINVVRNDLTHKTSDHYPLVAEFDVELRQT